MITEESYNLVEKQQELLWNETELERPITRSERMKSLFHKHFPISGNIEDAEEKEYMLPKPKFMFKENPWWWDNLQILKNDLNNVKNRLNHFNLDEWQQHTYQINQSGAVLSYIKKHIQPEFVTQAWCKFYEIVCNFSLVPLNEISRGGEGNEASQRSFTSVHLCEAPGAFVIALNHWLKLNARDVRWDWIASTLNPYYEGNPYSWMVADDRFIRHTLSHWYFGADNTGNLMDLRNLDALVERSKTINGGPIMLVTADGSIDCTDMPGEQENAVVHLHFCETVACLHLLQKGGNFLLKVFTLFEQQSVCIIYLLSCAFQQVTVTKPATSKAGNSETYVVCTNFKGRDYIKPYLNVLRQHYNERPIQAMFNCQDFPSSFMWRIEYCSKFFKHHQCSVIEDNISAFQSETYNKLLFQLRHIKRKIAVMYLKRYRLKKIDPTDEIVGQMIIEKSNNCIMSRKLHHDSYNERCKKQNLTPQERMQQIWSELTAVQLPTEKSYNWNLWTLPESLDIQIGKPFYKIQSSRFCEAKILQILNEVNSVMQDMHFTVCFPPVEITEQRSQLIDTNYETLNFRFIHTYDSHQVIVQVCNRLEKLQTGQTLLLIGYPLLTQLCVGLLYILRNSFDKITIRINDNEGYRIKLETYRRNERVLNHLHLILTMSQKALNENMAIWSIIPITILYEWDQYPVIMQLNHLVIKLYTCYIFNMINRA